MDEQTVDILERIHAAYYQLTVANDYGKIVEYVGESRAPALDNREILGSTVALGNEHSARGFYLGHFLVKSRDKLFYSRAFFNHEFNVFHNTSPYI